MAHRLESDKTNETVGALRQVGCFCEGLASGCPSRPSLSAVGSDENNQQTPEEVLAATVASLPDEKLTAFALRLALTGHTDIPRENDFDFLAEAESVFVPPQPKKKPAAKKGETTKPTTAKPEAAPKKPTKKAAVI